MKLILNTRSLLWISFGFAMSIYLVMLTYSLPYIEELSGGLAAFDMRPTGYSLDEALALLGALGDTGRDFYIQQQLLLDLFYPVLLAVFLWLSFIALSKHVTGMWSGMALIAKLCVPFVALLDYLENVGILMMLNSESLNSNLVFLTSSLTIGKSMITTAVFSLLLLVLLKVGFRSITKST